MTVKEGAAEFFYKKAVNAEAQVDLRGAIEDYQKAALLVPDEYAYRQVFADFALKNSGNQLLNADAQLNMLKLAEVNYTLASELNRFHPSIYYNLGITQLALYKISGNEVYYMQGLANLQKSVAIAVNNPLYPYQVGKALCGLKMSGAREEGKRMLQKALEIRPGYKDVEALLKL